MNVLFRCDASPSIGSGHVMRCLTLAREMRSRGWECAFIVSQDSVAFFIDGEFLLFVLPTTDVDGEVQEILGAAQKFNARFIILDHYGRDEMLEHGLRAAELRVAVLDDLADRGHDCDLLIDQTLGRVGEDYKGLVPVDSQILVGAEYALISPQYPALRAQAVSKRAQTDRVSNLLVSLGSTNYRNCTGFVLESLEKYTQSSLNINVVLGSAADKLDEIRSLVDRLNSQSHHDVVFHINARNMHELMLEADLAIGAGGTTSWERCSLGLPTIMIEIADNQTFVSAALQARGAVKNIGKLDEVTHEILNNALAEIIASPAMLKDMSQSAFDICDGRGRERIMPALLPHALSKNAKAVALRFIQYSDADEIYRWQCAPGVRQYSRNPQRPEREEHDAWMRASLNKTSRYPYIVMLDDVPAGIIRLDRLDDASNRYEISILISPEHQGGGVAIAAHKLLRDIHGNAEILAEVHPDNAPSVRLFESLGYQKINDREYLLAPIL